jgi:hypothetical protein
MEKLFHLTDTTATAEVNVPQRVDGQDSVADLR